MGLKEYIHQVLTQTGPNAVPYAQGAKWQIEEHLVELQQVFPSLAIRLSDFHANDGGLLHLLKAEGTIPIHYQGNKYNIPVVIWLTTRYPDEPPLPYIVPTANMVIKAGHPNVDRNGQVSCPILRSWNRHKNNLVELCLEMSQIFGSDPPLYSQPPPLTGTTSAPHPTPGNTNRPSTGTVQPPAGYPTYSASGYPPSQPPGGLQQNHRPSSSPALASMQGGQQQPGPYSFPINVAGQQSFSQPPTPPAQDAMAIAASNPLWGPAFSMAQQQQPNRPAFTGPPPPGMGAGPNANTNTQNFNYPSTGSGSNTPQPTFPTLYGSGQAPQPPPNFQPPAPSFPGAPSGGFPLGSLAAGLLSQLGGPAPPPPPPAMPPKPKLTQADVAANSRPLALHALKLQVEAAEKAWAAAAAAETNTLLEEQRVLGDRRTQLQAVVASLKAEREGTEGLVSEMGGKQAQLIAWLERNEPKAAAWRAATQDGQSIDWNKVLPAVDELSRQSLETQAADLAAEDAVLALDKALQAGLSGMTLEQYLKQVRLLCRRQFAARELGRLVSAAQQQSPIQPTRQGQGSVMSHPMPIVHGDSWGRPGI